MTSVWVVLKHEVDEKSEVLGLFKECPSDEIVLLLAGDGPWVKGRVGWEKGHFFLERIKRQMMDSWGRLMRIETK